MQWEERMNSWTSGRRTKDRRKEKVDDRRDKSVNRTKDEESRKLERPDQLERTTRRTRV